jgi:hypothetical protein
MISRRQIAIVLPLTVLAGCEFGPKQIEQTGYRGQGLEQIYDADNFRQQAAIPPEPYPLPADEGPRASEVYQNVQVLGDLSAERFNHLMASITAWVSPEQGCNYCHNPNNLADDSVYTKNVARRMLQMTRGINGRWANHVQDTGVTCYTCHRGQPVPQYIWAQEPKPDDFSVRGQKRGQNTPAANVGYASLPYSAFQRYLSGDPGSIRVASDSPIRAATAPRRATRRQLRNHDPHSPRRWASTAPIATTARASAPGRCRGRSGRPPGTASAWCGTSTSVTSSRCRRCSRPIARGRWVIRTRSIA